jgi:hypothetical protein
MRDYLTLVSLAVGGILLAGGNDLGILFVIPGIIYTIRTAE